MTELEKHLSEVLRSLSAQYEREQSSLSEQVEQLHVSKLAAERLGPALAREAAARERSPEQAQGRDSAWSR